MNSWKEVTHPDIAEIQMKITEFYVYTDSKRIDFPFIKYKIKILQSTEDYYSAYLNVAVINPSIGGVDYICGSGDSIYNAMTDAINSFIFSIEEMLEDREDKELNIDDFEWSDPHDF